MTSPDERSALDALLSAHDHTALVVVTLASVGVAPDPYLVADVADVPMPDAAAAVERTGAAGSCPTRACCRTPRAVPCAW